MSENASAELAPIEHSPEDGYSWCRRCGSSALFAECPNCDEYGYSHHDCGEDCCACLHPEPNVVCDWCDGKGGSWHCISSPEWCEANPMSGRENVPSTARRHWDD